MFCKLSDFVFVNTKSAVNGFPIFLELIFLYWVGFFEYFISFESYLFNLSNIHIYQLHSILSKILK